MRKPEDNKKEGRKDGGVKVCLLNLELRGQIAELLEETNVISEGNESLQIRLSSRKWIQYMKRSTCLILPAS